MSNKPRIVYFGSSDLSAEVLQDLVESGKFDIAAVFTQPDKPFGRKKILKEPPVKIIAKDYGLHVEQPVSMKKVAPLKKLRDINPDFGVVVAYGQILPQRVLDTAKFGFINGHASDLPRWRGAAPMERCLMAGDKSTAMCIMEMTVGLDEGDVLSREQLNIGVSWTLSDLAGWMRHSCSRQLIPVLLRMRDFDNNRSPQCSEGVTYANKITRHDSYANLDSSGRVLYDQWRALKDHYGLIFKYKDKNFIAWELEWLEEEIDAVPGTVLISSKRQLKICLKDGSMTFSEVQFEGKKRLNIANFLAGANISEGDVFEGFGGSE